MKDVADAFWRAAAYCLHPRVMLVVKYLGFLLGAFLVLRGLDRWIVSPATDRTPGLPHMKTGVLALLVASLLVVATEPFLLKAAPLVGAENGKAIVQVKYQFDKKNLERNASD